MHIKISLRTDISSIPSNHTQGSISSNSIVKIIDFFVVAKDSLHWKQNSHSINMNNKMRIRSKSMRHGQMMNSDSTSSNQNRKD